MTFERNVCYDNGVMCTIIIWIFTDFFLTITPCMSHHIGERERTRLFITFRLLRESENKSTHFKADCLSITTVVNYHNDR